MDAATQKLFLWVLDRAGRDGNDSWPLRFAAGDDHDLEHAVKSGSFSRELHDALDKIHVDLHAPVVAA